MAEERDINEEQNGTTPRAKWIQSLVAAVALFAIVISGLRIARHLRSTQDVAAAQRESHSPDYAVPHTEKFRPTVVIPKRFPPITDFPTKQASEVGDDLLPNELVLGVDIDGAARAYPINMLTGPQREIINDELNGQAIAATW